MNLLELFFQRNKNTYQQMVCGSPNQNELKNLSLTLDCPEYCLAYELDTSQFYIDFKGKIFLNESRVLNQERLLFHNILYVP